MSDPAAERDEALARCDRYLLIITAAVRQIADLRARLDREKP